MSTYQPPASVRANQHARALARRPQPCMLCQQWTKTVLYAAGWHCPPCAASRGLQPVAQEARHG
jgi:hypothetical protein